MIIGEIGGRAPRDGFCIGTLWIAVEPHARGVGGEVRLGRRFR